MDERFLLRLGRALHVHGTPSHRLESALDSVARALDCRATFLSTPTSLISSIEVDGEERMFLERLEAGEVNLGNLVLLDELAQAVIRGDLEGARGCEEIERILAAPPRYASWVVTLTCGLTSAAASILFGGTGGEILAALLCGTALGPLLLLPRWFARGSQLVLPASGFVVGLGASLLSAWIPLSVAVVSVAGLIVVVPGLSLTIAVTELARGSWVSGTARLSSAVLSFVLLVFGAVLGSRVGARILEQLDLASLLPPVATHYAFAVECLAAALTAICFLVLLQGLARDLPWMLLCGLATFAAARGVSLVSTPEVAALTGAFVAGFSSNLYARTLHRPAMVTRVSSLLLLVPGSIGFRGVESMVAGDTLSGLETAFNSGLVAVAIAVGLLLANVVLHPRQEL
jgi:uncharacterized membrane protein YjjP (DUF1212 family)